MDKKYEAYILSLTNLAKRQAIDEVDAEILRSYGSVLELNDRIKELEEENNQLKSMLMEIEIMAMEEAVRRNCPIAVPITLTTVNPATIAKIKALKDSK